MDSHTRLISVNESLKKTCTGKTKFYEIVKNGELKPIKLGRKTVFLEKEVDDWISEQVAKRDAKYGAA